MISIWFFVALAVAFFAIHLLRRRYVLHASDSNQGEHVVDGRDVKVPDSKGECCR